MNQIWTIIAGVFTSIISVSAIVAALAFVAKLWAEALFKQRELLLKAELDKQLKLTDRYSKGVEHLGSSDMAVRIGGIYELGQLLDIDPIDEFYWPVLDLLTSFIRLRAKSRPARAGQRTGGVHERIDDDMQAALNVIGRRQKLRNRPHDSPLDLSGLDLGDSWLAGAHLEWSYLSHANLDCSDIGKAFVSEAILDRATLTHCSIRGTTFRKSNLKEVDFSHSDLSESKFHRADLSGANFDKAILDKADLSGADLTGTETFLTQSQLNKARGDSRTRLPAVLVRPQHWITCYLADITPEGRIRSGQIEGPVDVLDATNAKIGWAQEVHKTEDGLALWSLTINGLALPDRRVIVDQEFRPADWI
jgi:uncharacterized protein YjbI with pentapeptide repeats